MVSTISRYEVQKILGEGGMGKVYLGLDPRSGQKVAIKELYPEYACDKNLRMRFEREANALSSLNHPNIVRFVEFIGMNNCLYLIMEYAEGQTLEKYISNVTGPIPEARTILFMEKILDAFAFAHSKGIVHRDIKPNNIMVTSDRDIKILDFGVAKLLDNKDVTLTAIGMVIGTSSFMSPEQAQGLTIDIRSDIYSIGVLLYQMVTGKPPYDVNSVSDIDIRLNIIRAPLPIAHEVYSFVSGHIQEVIDKATQKNMNLRYQNCVEFSKALKSELQDLANRSYANDVNTRTITIGRGSSCDIIINDPNVSRVHAEISVAGGQYVYRDVSTNGSIVNGHRIINEKIVVALNSSIFLANSISLPWNKVILLLPLSSSNQEENIVVKQHSSEPVLQNASSNYQQSEPSPSPDIKNDRLGVGWGILAFLIPIAGWIMYFAWREETPKRAMYAGLIGIIGLIFNLLFIFG